ncbi:MAG: FtsQ-type POTRA domain-containing protein [Oscillospiraceae bacterium]|nr:FtsQ-type POTRA domain-containing protein [Oscillospiraceae bacterium]
MPQIHSRSRRRSHSRPRTRKQEPTRSNTRRRVKQNNILYILPVCVMAIVLIAVLSSTVFFNAKTIVVTASSSPELYTDEEILEAGGIETGVNLMRFDISRAEAEITEKLVKLDGVEIKRVFPSTLEVNVINGERILSVLSGGEYWGVSGGHRVINTLPTRPTGLVITGLELEELYLGGAFKSSDDATTGEKLRIVLALYELVAQREMPITRIDITNRFEVVLFYGEEAASAVGGERIEIRMGSATQLPQKLTIAQAIIDEQIAPNESGVLRVSSLSRVGFFPNLQ